MRALAFEHLASDPIGVFGDVLTERGIAVDRIRLYDGEPVPEWRDYDLIVGMGAGVSVWQEDEYPWIVPEKRAVREAVLAGVPYFGVCFGVQLLADVFGARSFQGPEPEIGVNQVFLTTAARRDPVFRGFPADLEVCEWHSNHFSLPPGAVRLARSPRYENQAIRYGRVAYGIQCHLEPSIEDIRDWLSDGSDKTFERRHGAGSVARLLDDYGPFVPFLQETGRQVFGRWLQNALTFGVRAGQVSRRGSPAWRDRGRSGLFGREHELARIRALTGALRHGESAVLVLRGEPGIGKSALLDEARRSARGVRVLRADGESRTEPFGGLAELCRPFAELCSELPSTRAAAIAPLLGGGEGTAAVDRFAVYAAAFGLLASAAERTPLLVLIDDAHLLDDGSREAIAFIAARVGAEPIALLIATESEDDLSSAEELRLAPLEAPDAQALLAHRWPDLQPTVAEEVAGAVAGNPLALLEITATLSASQRTGTESLDSPLPASAEWAFLQRVSAQPPRVRQALLVAALAAPNEFDEVKAAWRRIGLDGGVLEEIQASRLVIIEEGRLLFVHPLARTVVSYSALRADRRAAHAALSEVTGGDASVWHRARGAAAPDEAVAQALEHLARRAQDQTAYAAATDAFERAARLSPADDSRAARLIEAAQAAQLAGHVNGALIHADGAVRHARDEALRRQAEHLRGRILARSGSAELARNQLVAVAAHYERTDPIRAGSLLADAVLPALRAGGPGEAVRLARRAERLARADAEDAPVPVLVALGMALVFAGDYAEGAALLDDAAMRADAVLQLQPLAYLGAGLELAGRHDAARAVLERVIEEARTSGSISILPYALIRLADGQLETGEWAAATAALREAASLADETGQSADRGLALGALAWIAGARGQAPECLSYLEEAVEIAERLGSGSRLDRAGTAVGLLELSRGNPSEAILPLDAACRRQDAQGWSDAARTPHRRPDLIEAFVLAGRMSDARGALDRFRVDAERSQRPSALATAARCAGLLADGGEFDRAFEQALAQPNGVGPFEQARTELLYGMRLVDAGRGEEASRVLVSALKEFERLGADPWAARAQDGIVAAGGAVPQPQSVATEQLSPRELEVALAAARGATAPEIAEQLFLGPRTVQLALASSAIKLGVGSQEELVEVLRHASAVAAR